jgi:2-amino-4-hydroxy-6-hydroxymethyldihydropteridine diphosphokinase
MSRTYLALGSNLGDPRAMIERALAGLAKVGTVRARSGLYRTPPLGPPQPWYLNAAAGLDTELAPRPLLSALKSLETELGREPGERWGPRLIDLDLLLYGDRVLETEGLTLPHPELAARPFVLVPLAEIAPDLVHPTLGVTIAALRDRRPAAELAAIERLDSLGSGD